MPRDRGNQTDIRSPLTEHGQQGMAYLPHAPHRRRGESHFRRFLRHRTSGTDRSDQRCPRRPTARHVGPPRAHPGDRTYLRHHSAWDLGDGGQVVVDQRRPRGAPPRLRPLPRRISKSEWTLADQSPKFVPTTRRHNTELLRPPHSLMPNNRTPKNLCCNLRRLPPRA